MAAVLGHVEGPVKWERAAEFHQRRCSFELDGLDMPRLIRRMCYADKEKTAH